MAYIEAGVNTPAYPVRVPIRKPEDTAIVPAIVVRLVTDFSGHVHTGPNGLLEQRIQLDIFAETFDDVAQLSADTRRLLDGYRGPLGVDVTVGHCHLDNNQD